MSQFEPKMGQLEPKTSQLESKLGQKLVNNPFFKDQKYILEQ